MWSRFPQPIKLVSIVRPACRTPTGASSITASTRLCWRHPVKEPEGCSANCELRGIFSSGVSPLCTSALRYALRRRSQPARRNRLRSVRSRSSRRRVCTGLTSSERRQRVSGLGSDHGSYRVCPSLQRLHHWFWCSAFGMSIFRSVTRTSSTRCVASDHVPAGRPPSSPAKTALAYRHGCAVLTCDHGAMLCRGFSLCQ